MAFYETALGYVGLGSMTIFRTAAQAAKDLEDTAAMTADARATGGLRDKELAFQYATGQGRLKDLDAEAQRVEKNIKYLESAAQTLIERLEGFGAVKPGQMAVKLLKTAAAFKFPILGWMEFLPFDIDIPGFGGKTKKHRIESTMKELEGVQRRWEQEVERHQKIQKEGTALAQQLETAPPEDLKVQLVAIPQKNVIKNTFNRETGLIETQKLKKDVKDVGLPLYEEMAKRAESLGPGTARLPEGFSTLYSPAFKNKAIIQKNEPTQTAITKEGPVVTGKKLVYGGLAGPEDVQRQSLLILLVGLGTMAVFTGFLASEDRRKARAYR